MNDTSGKSKTSVRDQIEQRFEGLGEQLNDTAEGLRNASDQLRSRGNDAVASAVQELANRTQRLSDYLKNAGVDSVIADARSFARRPWVIATAGALLGFAVSHSLKGARRKRYSDHYGDSYGGIYGAGGYGSP